jgi:hypothetical protein
MRAYGAGHLNRAIGVASHAAKNRKIVRSYGLKHFIPGNSWIAMAEEL